MKDTRFASYEDDNSPYTKGDILDDIIEILESDSVRSFQWFKNNQMKTNKDKCHLLISARCHKTTNVCGAEIKSSDCKKILLRIKID